MKLILKLNQSFMQEKNQKLSQNIIKYIVRKNYEEK